MKSSIVVLLLIAFCSCSVRAQNLTGIRQSAKIWQEKVSLPTYLVDPPDLNPRFYDGGHTRVHREGYILIQSMRAFQIPGL